jgi:hypothetical protein
MQSIAYDFSQKSIYQISCHGICRDTVFWVRSNFKEIQKINFSEFVPGSDADMVNLKYTDSGRIAFG